MQDGLITDKERLSFFLQVERIGRINKIDDLKPDISQTKSSFLYSHDWSFMSFIPVHLIAYVSLDATLYRKIKSKEYSYCIQLYKLAL